MGSLLKGLNRGQFGAPGTEGLIEGVRLELWFFTSKNSDGDYKVHFDFSYLQNIQSVLIARFFQKSLSRIFRTDGPKFGCGAKIKSSFDLEVMGKR